MNTNYSTHIDSFWDKRLEDLGKVFESSGYISYIVGDLREAYRVVTEKIVPELAPKRVSWGDSQTFLASGLFDFFKSGREWEFIDIEKNEDNFEENLETRRQALLTDLFLTGSNAVTEDGMLVNLDMIGNRVGGITFGPRNVVILVGRNKIVPDLDTALDRVKEYAAPVNAIRFGLNTPCAITSRCNDCSSKERICNYWTITERSFPAGRIRVVLINQDLGF